MNLRVWVLLIGLMTAIQDVCATPRTRIEPYASLEGASIPGRFGEEVECSTPTLGARARSVVAVAAPAVNGGIGAVYLYDPADTAAPFQTLAPDSAELVVQFGSAVEFIDDVNGDGADDLLVGASGVSTQVDGRLYAFVSTHQEGALRFIQCGILIGAHDFADRLFAIRGVGGEGYVKFVAGIASESQITGYKVSVQGDGACFFTEDASFAATGEAMYPASSFSQGPICSQVEGLEDSSSTFGRVISHLGGSFAGLVGEDNEAFAATGSEPATGGSLALYGVTQEGSCGELFELNNCRFDSYQEQGSALAGGDQCQTEHGGGMRRFLVAGSPGWSGGRGRVDIYLEGTEYETAVMCENVAVSLLISETTPAAQTGLEITPAPTSSGPIAASPEESGPALTTQPSTPISTPIASVAATLPVERTAAPEISVTVAPTQTSGGSVPSTPATSPTGGIPSGPPTPVPTSITTLIPVAPQMPVSSATTTPVLEPTDGFGPDQTPTQTSSPTPTEEDSDDSSEIYEPTPQYSPTATSTSTSRQDDGVGPVYDNPSIPVFPGAAGLPTPEVTQVGDQVEIAMPVVKPELSSLAETKAIRTLMKRGRLSRKRAQSILADPRNLVVTYIVTYSEVAQQARFSLIQSAHADDGRRRRSGKIKRVRSRHNQVTLARLQPGATYRVSYQVEIAVRKPRAVIGVTKASGVTQFVYDS